MNKPFEPSTINGMKLANRFVLYFHESPFDPGAGFDQSLASR